MNILLFGRNGQLGWELQRSLAPLGRVAALSHDSTDYCGDFARPDAVAATVRALRPGLIVNAAAHTAVDLAESEPERARLLNATAPGVLAKEAARLGAWLVHYSSDYVFDGSGTRPWLEADAPAPLCVYGATKWEGEQLIQQSGCRHLILRTSWVYGARGGNFARTMLRLARERERLTVIDDQWGAPTGAELLADVTAHAVRHLQTHPEHGGLYHCVAGGETNWFSYAKYVISQARQAQPAIQIKANEVAPVPTSAYPTPARRPSNSRLDTAKLRTTFGLTLPPWEQGVARMLAEIL
ncbi:dTDP-4-dehydrorhamnose reductase [Comamonas flocculans]|uniref:dTDP-4-dehydrorhamnose reductase n=1 Tax=Comamonas flocculans TaxID=2597701 RepID=A0A5B8RUM7_9BURK|nr:dTDP-4-dehydrorhamnose reductase [Comamonas flocculans]QEA13221.1 dTDP-4-dehydrorhamnose reductase [Comamonas flocculans]